MRGMNSHLEQTVWLGGARVLVQAQEDGEAHEEVQSVEGRAQTIHHRPVLKLHTNKINILITLHSLLKYIQTYIHTYIHA